MTSSVKLTMRADKTLELVKMLRDQGYTQNVDFDFAHHIPRWDHFSYEPVEKPYTTFTFYNDQIAFLFQLRHSSE